MPRYKVTLTEEEQKELEALIQKGGKGYRMKHAHILLKQASYDERTNALRRALYRVLGTEEQQEQMFMSPAQQLVQRKLEELEDKINSRGGCTINVDF